MAFREILGGYFPYCQWCKYDGNCVLKHHEFMGTPSQGEIDKTPYPGHEDLGWHGTAFHAGRSRSTCVGRIGATRSCFYPLACECGTVVNSLTFGSFCQKFVPNPKAKMREAIYRALSQLREESSDQLILLEFDDFSRKPDTNVLSEEELERLEELCPCDHHYQAAMKY